MRATLFNSSTRAQIHARLYQLSPASLPQWGTIQASEMLCHVADHLRVAIGDIEARPRRIVVKFANRTLELHPGLLRFKLGRQLLVHWIPWPRARIGAPPEMFSTVPGKWSEDIASLHALVDRVGKRGPAGAWGMHPFFGSVPGQEWGRLCWEHLDHHLRQFGV